MASRRTKSTVVTFYVSPLATMTWAGGWTFECRLASSVLPRRSLGFGNCSQRWFEVWVYCWELWGLHIPPRTQRTRESGCEVRKSQKMPTQEHGTHK